MKLFIAGFIFCFIKMKLKLQRPRNVNVKVIVYCIIALGFIALTLLIDWIFIIGAIAMIWLNQKELIRGKLK